MRKDTSDIVPERLESEIIEESETEILNMTKKRCTKMKTNRRVFMPPGRPAQEEASLTARLRT